LAPQRGQKRRIVDFALQNAQAALARHLAMNAGQEKLLKGVAALFNMEDQPKRIEVYDNSHISGTNMVGAMIVAGPDGFQKNAYRVFNIKQAVASDDYGMMREVLIRRFKRALKDEGGVAGESWPDLLLIDGGAGQLSAALEALHECGVANDVTVVGIAKGPERNAGREKFFMPGQEMFQLPVNDPVLHFLQRLRDEAHRFAIGAHRVRRTKKIITSPLDEVSGIGAKRKKALLLHFGSAKAVAAAGLEDLEKVEGISHSVAQKIYDHFHG
jgi:excinuclease ABC subunit C